MVYINNKHMVHRMLLRHKNNLFPFKHHRLLTTTVSDWSRIGFCSKNARVTSELRKVLMQSAPLQNARRNLRMPTASRSFAFRYVALQQLMQYGQLIRKSWKCVDGECKGALSKLMYTLRRFLGFKSLCIIVFIASFKLHF